MSTKVGILSMGDMGVGIAKLLVAHGFAVATNVAGRSQDTVDRATAARVDLLASDVELVRHCDVILSVVPPRDALNVAKRIVAALPAAGDRAPDRRRHPLYFVDMNAVAPATSRDIAALFDGTDVRFIDGCILGGPPAERPASSADGATSATTTTTWDRPLMPMSGPYRLDDDNDVLFPGLADTLNTRHLSNIIGSASGLKMCFAALTKGYAAIAVQAYTTAHELGVLDDLQWALTALMPARVPATERALTGMPPKAYRWVREMEEISATFAGEGGFTPALFQGAADVFRAVAADAVLGQEKVGQRQRGQTAEDVAAAMAEGLKKAEKTSIDKAV